MPYYVFKQNGKIVAKCDYKPSIQDIQSRQEKAVYIDKDVDILFYKIVNGKLTVIQGDK